MIAIVSDVPYPSDKKPGPGRRARYPFGAMEIGQSFLVSPEEHRRIVTAASWYGRRNDKRFSVLRVENGYRCWRIA